MNACFWDGALDRGFCQSGPWSPTDIWFSTCPNWKPRISSSTHTPPGLSPSKEATTFPSQPNQGPESHAGLLFTPTPPTPAIGFLLAVYLHSLKCRLASQLMFFCFCFCFCFGQLQKILHPMAMKGFKNTRVSLSFLTENPGCSLLSPR